MSSLLDASPSVFLLIVLGGLAVIVIAWMWIAGLFNASKLPNAMPDTNIPPPSNPSSTLPPALTKTTLSTPWAGERRAASTFAAAPPTTAVSLSVPARKAETAELFHAESPQTALHDSATLSGQWQATDAPLSDSASVVIYQPPPMVAAASNPAALTIVEGPLPTAPKLRPWQLCTPAPLHRRPPLSGQKIRLLHLG